MIPAAFMFIERRVKPDNDGGEVIAIAHWRTTP
jgi:hypothetical protein